MRYANILLFVVATVIGTILSIAAMWRLPFAIFTIPTDGFDDAVKLLSQAPGGGMFYDIEALKDVMAWGNIINFVFATVCAILALLPVLATIRLAEKKLFEKQAYRGWKMIVWLAGLGALAVAIWPVPLIILPYIVSCALLMAGYIVIYQWPRNQAKDPLKMPELRRPEPRPHRMIAGEET